MPKSERENLDICVEDFRLVAGTRTLLENVNAKFKANEITLIVGPSGVGKSLLLKIMAGLIGRNDAEIHFSGKVSLGNKPAKAGRAGVVFQQFALFDELSPKANVEFAQAHQQHRKSATKASSREILKDLRVPTNVWTSQLSGGQRQRLALARALAYQPGVLLYDEPTSGLDLGTARKVAHLIEQTQEQHRTTSIIVTHDYESLLSIADEVFFLDPNSKELRNVPKDQWESLPVMLDEIAQKHEPEHIGGDEIPVPKFSLVKGAAKFFASTSRGVEELVRLPISLIPIWRSPRWGSQYFLHYCRLVFGPTAWVYLLVAGLIIGYVTTFFIFKFLPFETYTEPLIIDDLLLAIGYTLYRILVPILATILIAARCGAAVSADVGSKQYGRQIDAMRAFGVSPRRYLLTNILFAFLIGTPLLTLLCFWATRTISLISFAYTHPAYGPDFWHLHFHRKLVVPGEYFWTGTYWLIGKLLISGVGIALISYSFGSRPKYSANDVSRAVTSTILWSTLYVLSVHFIFAFLEF